MCKWYWWYQNENMKLFNIITLLKQLERGFAKATRNNSQFLTRKLNQTCQWKQGKKGNQEKWVIYLMSGIDGRHGINNRSKKFEGKTDYAKYVIVLRGVWRGDKQQQKGREKGK